MKRPIMIAIFTLATLLFLPIGSIEGKETNNPPSSVAKKEDRFQKVEYLLDFSDYREGSIFQWLETKGFKAKEGAKDQRKIDLDVSESALLFETKNRARGFLVNEKVDIEKFSSVRIEWGIRKYPQGASYEKGVNNEALMLYIFFGYDKISSGHFLIPNSPYFIGLYLCDIDLINKAYKGRYFHKQGRFICLANPEPGETIISEFDLVSAFQSYYENDEIPVISGISLGIDTSSSGGNGRSSAFIKSIEFLE